MTEIPAKQVVYLNNLPWHMPRELVADIMSWERRIKSPFSHSYYNLGPGEKTWDDTPLDSLRVSDHWNFQAHGKTHCPTDVPVRDNSHWTLVRWDGEKYIVIKSIARRPASQLTDEEAKGLPTRIKNQRQRSIEKARNRLTQPPVSATDVA